MRPPGRREQAWRPEGSSNEAPAMKKLLMLGGSDIQVHAIRRAVEMGLRVVTCDNRPENPGHAFAHEYHEVSTTDLDGVLALARSLGIDGVLAYASDPAALPAAYVADHMGLPGDPLEAVRRAQDKLLLRATQREVGLPVPDFVDASDTGALMALRARHPQGIIVKPADASGSRGVNLVPGGAPTENACAAVRSALQFSRSRRAIAESIWGRDEELQFGADALVVDGLIRYIGFGDQIMSDADGARINAANIGPSTLTGGAKGEIERQAQTLVATLGLRSGVYNFDIRPDDSGKFAIIDFGARIGGTLIAYRHQAVDGIDLVNACIRIALGQHVQQFIPREKLRCAMMLVVRSSRSGVLREVRFSREVRSSVLQSTISARPGDEVRPYRTSADRLGVLIIRSDSRHLLNEIAAEPERFYTVVLEGDAT